MSEWKELKTDSLPSDILTGDYEFEYSCKEIHTFTKWCVLGVQGRLNLIACVYFNHYCVRYRKPEPKTPTHKEIMTKWWRYAGDMWLKVTVFSNNAYKFSEEVANCRSAVEYVNKKWFTGRESADIPPEEVK